MQIENRPAGNLVADTCELKAPWSASAVKRSEPTRGISRPLVNRFDRRPQQPRLALSAFAEQHDVVPGDQRPLQLRDHGVLDAQDARPPGSGAG